MRWNALVLAAVATLAVWGCKSKDKAGAEIAYDQPAYDLYDEPVAATPRSSLTSTTPVTTSYEPSPYDTPSYGSAPIESDPTLGTFGSRTHTVSKKDTLYKLARQYYGDAKKWREIYDANRDQIANPNMIRVGQRLVIP